MNNFLSARRAATTAVPDGLVAGSTGWESDAWFLVPVGHPSYINDGDRGFAMYGGVSAVRVDKATAAVRALGSLEAAALMRQATRLAQ